MFLHSITGCSGSQDQAVLAEGNKPVASEKVYTWADYEAYRDDPRNASLCLNATRDLVEGGVLLEDIPEGILNQLRSVADWTPRDHQFAYRAGSEKVYLSSWIAKLDPVRIDSSQQVAKHLEQVVKINAILEHLESAYAAGEKVSVIDRQFLLFSESWDQALSKADAYAKELAKTTEALIKTESQLENLAEANAAATKLSELVGKVLDDAQSTGEKYQAMFNSDEWIALNFAVIIELIQADDPTNPLGQWSTDEKIELLKKLVNAGDPPAAGIAAVAAVELFQRPTSNEERRARLKTAAETLCEQARRMGDATSHYATAKLYLEEKDPRSIEELEKASDIGLPIAAMALGDFYLKGELVGSSVESACRYYKRAFDLGWRSVGPQVAGVLHMLGRRDEVVELCHHESMQSNPERIFKVAEAAYKRSPRFARELMVIARDAGISNADTAIAAKATTWLETTKPSVVFAELEKETAAYQAQSDAREVKQRMLQIQHEVDEQMEYNIWLSKQP